jgi:hypothetical protein
MYLPLGLFAQQKSKARVLQVKDINVPIITNNKIMWSIQRPAENRKWSETNTKLIMYVKLADIYLNI